MRVGFRGSALISNKEIRMADRYFKKDKNKYSVGYSDVIFKYDPRNHDVKSLESRFVECSKDGKEIKKAVKKETKKAKK